jgi:hypothetical protein
MLRVITTAFAVVSLLAASGIAMAQTTGNLRGLVKDATGAVLPGATVTISSPAQIGGPKTTITNGQGVYRFPSIAVGTYTVEFSMTGFQTFIAEGVPVGLNLTMTIDATLNIADVAETITVTGESPVLDITKSGYSSNWKAEMVEELPTNRNFWDFAQMSPGIASYSPDGQGSRIVAFGSGQDSNSWNVDGVSVNSKDGGSSWWWINPDMIEEVEVNSFGASAEYGNAMGATVNIVTKSGGNEFHGNVNAFFQTQGLTGNNVTVDGFGFNRDEFTDITAYVGGPIAEDKIWFMSSYQYKRDGFTSAGNDPDFVFTEAYDRFDIKVTSQISEKNSLDGMFHIEIYDCCGFVQPNISPSATGSEFGENPAWKIGWTSVINDTTLFEVKYAGWYGDDAWDSVTGSTEEAFFDYTPPGGGPIAYSGGVLYPWDYDQWTHEVAAKTTKYAENFLSSQHDFKFGVQWGYGSAVTPFKLSPTGSYAYTAYYGPYYYYGYAYVYSYNYRVYQQPYSYGGTSQNLGVFVDDSITIGEKLTLNLGLRFDHHTGNLSDAEFLTVGESSPGADGLIKWNNWSPRFGFAFTPVRDGGALIKGSAGIYYAQNTMGNWDGQIINRPPYLYFERDPVTGETGDFAFDFLFGQDVLNFDIKNPRAIVYSLGYEQQVSDNVSVGVEYVYKETEDLIGWDIIGGEYQHVPYTDPFTGNQYLLLEQLETPTIQKGNGPFLTDNIQSLLPFVPRYRGEYNGVFLTFNKRYSDGWGLSGSYTWSKSEGLQPNPQSGSQYATVYASSAGSNPNNFINGFQRLQGDRPHMFRLQGVFNLPADVMFSTSVNFMSGRPFSRQVRLRDLGVPTVNVIMAPAGSDEDAVLSTGKVLPSLRFSTNYNWDIRIGKRFPLGETAAIKVDGVVLNVLNDDAELGFSTLRLNPGDTFVPDVWVYPRRLMLYFGFEF